MERPWLKAYDAWVPRTIEYPEVPVYRPFLDSASLYPESVAVIDSGREITYAELAGRVRSLARALSGLGVDRTGRVGILLPDREEIITSYYAALMTGAAVVMLGPMLVERELTHMLADASVTTLITTQELWGPIERAADPPGIERVVLAGDGPGDIPAPARPDIHSLELLVEGGGQQFAAPPCDPRADTAVFIYTGGTTGRPKAVMLSHFAVVANALQLGSWIQVGQGDRALAVLPLFHSFGMSTGINTPLYGGASVVLAGAETPGELARLIESYRPNVLVGVPSIFAGLVEDGEARAADLSSLEYCFAGAASVPRSVTGEFEKTSGASLMEGYGLTEAVTAQSANPASGLNKAGSIGLPFPDVEFRIVDLETGRVELEPEKAGELTVRSPCLMQGYHNMPAETERALRDGWLYTSDVAWMDPDGYFYVIDRKKDLVISGAFKAYPAEVEEVLLTHPDIRETAVVGLFDDFRGHSLKAYIVTVEGSDLTAQDVLEFCRSNLAEYKVPREVEFREELPHGPLGKILRDELR